MEIQAQATMVLQVQAAMLLFLGLVVLLAHWSCRRLKSNNGAAWFAVGAMLGSVGLLLQANYATLPPLLSVMLGNALFLGHIVLLTVGVARVTQQRCGLLLALQGMVAFGMLGFLAYFTWWQPSRPHRVLAAMLILPLLFAKPIYLLLRARDRVIRPATLTLAGLLGVLSAGMLVRAWVVARTHDGITGASWVGMIFIAGCVLCFLWMDMLRISSQMESQAMTDPLTGLLNRRAMDTFAQRELARCQRHGQAIAALMIDIDNFKQVNDNYGHSVGDRVLVSVACAIRSSLRMVDLAARVGGDEFLVLLPDASDMTVQSVTIRLRWAIQEVRVPTGIGESISVTASIGETRSTLGDTTLQDLVDNSDRSMYLQKQAVHAVGTRDTVLT